MSYFDEVRTAFRQGETELVERLSHQELHRARAAADPPAEVEALCMLARAAVRRGDLTGAGQLAAEARTVARNTGRLRLEQGPVHILAGCARLAGDTGGARALLRESIALNERLGESRMVAVDQANLGYVELHAGHLDAARDLFGAARHQVFLRGTDDMVPVVTLAAAALTAAEGDHLGAALLLGTAEGAYRATGNIPDPDDAIELATLRDRLVSVLGRAPFDDAASKGVGLDPRQVLGSD